MNNGRIVDKINNSIGQDPTAKSIIGVLDIYGFESFKINSFEQLCINLTNEKLQQHFNQHVFKMEQEEYTKEEINWSYVEFVDNQDVLDLIEKKPGGIIALLDEACMFPKSTHETFAQKMYQTYNSHKRFSKPKLSRTNFTINHYAGDVTYQADHFLDKNKDYVVAEHQALLNDSSCPFVANLFPPLEETSKQSKFSSIGTRFKASRISAKVAKTLNFILYWTPKLQQQLQSLMETLSTTEPHYIRCVKPNTVLKPGIFENDNVLNQLRCGGVLEAIRISCAGYPTKRSFDEFLERFGMLAPDVLDGSDEKSACVAICDRFGLKGYQIGKSKVFLRAGQMAELDARRTEVLATAARRIQRQIRTYLTRKEFIILRRATITMQKHWRARLARKLYDYLRKEAASIRIQKHTRGGAARISYKLLQGAAISIQTGLRAMAARDEYRRRRRNKAATIVQTQWRRFSALSAYKHQKKASLTLQCLWRSKVARKELRMLKMAARDAGALREAKDKLEKRVEELTWRLDFEKHLRVDLEEAKGQEITKLQNALQEMQGRLDEAHNQILHEKEAAKIAIEQAPPVIKEVPVVDNTKVEELANHNHKLEDEILELKKRVEEFEHMYSEVENESNARLKELEESQVKISGLQDTIQRLDANLSNLESENQVLRQQALVGSTNEELTEETEHVVTQSRSLILHFLQPQKQDQGTRVENELLRNQKMIVEQITTPEKVLLQVQDSFETPHVEHEKTKESDNTVSFLTKQKSLTDRQQENHDVLIKCLMEDKRFDKTRPVAACIVYKTLWRSFEAEKTHIFDRIIHIIRSSIEVAFRYLEMMWGHLFCKMKLIRNFMLLKTQDNNIKDLAYWLSTTSTLLFLLQSTIKASGSPYKSPHRNRASPTTLFGRMTQGFRASPSLVGIVEWKGSQVHKAK
ncbi:LOW QUALITY PROTEIN: hypothetical protein OSB04_001567 [Centaurea solstitialis]|uniref:Myosin motor domain-containing protein n=1 Tax=Centaurea solstitialis TaxID=347529 RepID=A0AA38U1T4_9ASTR|nr:LOW QUALITY PROTEIN: hypothetical protein OSB04_001567 [Centaurea solstitialis]